MSRKFLLACFITGILLYTSQCKIIDEDFFKNTQYLCPEGQALQSFKRFQVHDAKTDYVDYQYTISCLNISICNESCEWSDKCSLDQYGVNVHIGGLMSAYNHIMYKRFLLFLCCNSSEPVTGETNCTSLPLITNESFEISIEERKIIRQASTDKSADSKFFVSLETCNIASRGVFSKCAAADEERSQAKKPLDFYFKPALSGLAGLAGLALIVGGGGNPTCCSVQGLSCADGCASTGSFLCTAGICA